MKHKFLTYAVAAFVLFFLVTNPTGAAGTAHAIAIGLGHLATSIGDFLTSVTGGAR